MNREEAVLLCRISDQKQEDGYSLDAQERFGIEYCQKKGFNVIEKFRFVETGSKVGKRNKFDAMMDFIRIQVDRRKTNRPIHLIVEKPDRLTRNFTNREQLQLLVMMGKLEIHYYKDRRIVDKNCSPADIFTDDMMTSVSKYIALNIAREVKKGLLEKARNGWYPAHPPIGYKYTRDGIVGKHGRKEARIIVDTEMKPIVYRIFELRAVQRKSYEAISNVIREEFKDLKGRTYKFTKSGVEKILVHPFYGGTFEWAGETYEGKHEVFIPPSWIDMAQGKMRGTPNKPMPLGPFSQFMKCAIPECGCQVIYHPITKRNRRTGTERVYHYYHCTDGKRVHKKLGLREVNVSEAKIWEQFEQAVQSFSINETVAKTIAARMFEMNQESAAKAKQQHDENKQRLEAMIRKADQLYDDYAKQLIDEDDYRRLKAKSKDEMQVLRRKLENDYESTQSLVQERLKFTLELAKDAESNWNSSTPPARVVLLKNVLWNFSLDGLNVRYDLKKPFAVLSEIKLKGVSEKWCAREDLNLHEIAPASPSS